MEKKIIWSNRDLYIKDWDFDPDWIKEKNPTDDEKYERMCDDNNFFLDDERNNLDIALDNPILIIADLGLWNGRKQGYKIIGHNIKDILFTDCDYATWFSDEKDIRSTFIHHDGTNHCLYREIKDMDTIDELTTMIYNGNGISDEDLDKYTKSIKPYVDKVYGW